MTSTSLSPGEERLLRVINESPDKKLSYDRLCLLAAYSLRHVIRLTGSLEQKGALRRQRASNQPYHYEVLCSF